MTFDQYNITQNRRQIIREHSAGSRRYSTDGRSWFLGWSLTVVCCPLETDIVFDSATTVNKSARNGSLMNTPRFVTPWKDRRKIWRLDDYSHSIWPPSPLPLCRANRSDHEPLPRFAWWTYVCVLSGWNAISPSGMSQMIRTEAVIRRL